MKAMKTIEQSYNDAQTVEKCREMALYFLNVAHHFTQKADLLNQPVKTEEQLEQELQGKAEKAFPFPA